ADLQEDLGDLRLGDAVVERAAQMRTQLVRPVENRDHGEVEHAARLERQAFATPDRAPAIFVEDVLQRTVEVIDVLVRGVDIDVAEHLAANAHALVVHGLVHAGFPPMWRRAQTRTNGGMRTLPDGGSGVITLAIAASATAGALGCTRMAAALPDAWRN